MRKLCPALLLATTLVVASFATVASASEGSLDKPAKRGVSLRAATTDVTEGDRLKLTAKIKSPGDAKKVTLEMREINFFGDPEWTAVKTVRVKGHKKVKFTPAATSLNSEQYRATVAYDNGKKSRSNAIPITVWRWIPLSDYAPYFSTAQVGFPDFVLNGQSFEDGWGPSSNSKIGLWESKFTPARKCRSFRGVLGLSDISVDGSSGKIKVTAEDVVVYESPALTPGMDLPITLPIANPFRLGLQSTNTSLPGLLSWPVVGDPALLCTGL